jgi:hypothetical protein
MPESDLARPGGAPYLRLVWSNPNPRPPGRADPAHRVNLALAIERHLAGGDGLTEQAFVTLYSGRTRSCLSPVLAPLPS